MLNEPGPTKTIFKKLKAKNNIYIASLLSLDADALGSVQSRSF